VTSPIITSNYGLSFFLVRARVSRIVIAKVEATTLFLSLALCLVFPHLVVVVRGKKNKTISVFCSIITIIKQCLVVVKVFSARNELSFRHP
jgi:hypothetical protein